uniref:Uncharacterized protein n=1 Tax=Octopus bimaculoides TaxID=37653 RepID=A0A0L8I0U3_OCTBM
MRMKNKQKCVARNFGILKFCLVVPDEKKKITRIMEIAVIPLHFQHKEGTG